VRRYPAQNGQKLVIQQRSGTFIKLAQAQDPIAFLCQYCALVSRKSRLRPFASCPRAHSKLLNVHFMEKQ
jgi:hypothetical protein